MTENIMACKVLLFLRTHKSKDIIIICITEDTNIHFWILVVQ